MIVISPRELVETLFISKANVAKYKLAFMIAKSVKNILENMKPFRLNFGMAAYTGVIVVISCFAGQSK